MAWNITGRFIESCSCNMLCPCWYGVKELMVMDQGWCAGAVVVPIQRGSADGVNLGGLIVAFAIDWPGPTLYDGNGTARLYIDQAANANQRQALEAIFQGKKGGPMEVLASMVSRWLPTQVVDIRLQEEGDAITATVGPFGQYKAQRLRSEAGRPMMMQNVGFASVLRFENETADLAPSSSQWSDPEMPRRFETKSGAVASFTWSGS
jgi:hypothetical protein